MCGLSKQESAPSETDFIIWNGRVRAHLKVHQPGITTIRCFLRESGEVEIPLRNRTNEDIFRAARILGNLFAQGNVIRWEMHTIPKPVPEDRVT